MLSISPDDRPIVGNLKHYPNIFVNAGHGQRSTGLAFMSGKAISEIIEG
jgi:glycine/D-amino acid oxidase-like deaminating enzyme